MKYSPKNLANIMAGIHWAWIFAGLVSLPLTILVNGYYIYSLAFLALTIVSWVVFRGCVLITWENKFRNKYSPHETYEGAFITHYLNKYFSLRVSTFFVRAIIYCYMLMLLIVSLIKYYEN